MIFSGTVPKGFVLAKPIEHTNYDPKTIYKLEERGALLITRKRNGWKMFLEVNAEGKIRFLTDGINEIAREKVKHLIMEAQRMSLPPRTLLVGEATATPKMGADDRGLVGSLISTKDPKRIAEQKNKLHFAIFNIVFWDGEDITQELLFANRLLVSGTLFLVPQPYIFLVEGMKENFDEAKKVVIREKWEGLVLYDTDYKITYRTDGKSPERPEGCWKWKPEFDGDFIVREVIYRPDGKTVKELVLLQIDPTTGQEFNCGKYGCFTAKMRKWLSEEAVYPLVVELKFDGRYESGKLENPRGFIVRHDKKPEHCVAAKSFPKAGMK